MLRTTRRFTLTLAAAISLALIAAARDGWRPRPPAGGPPLTLVSVAGLSWDRVTPLARAGRLPGLSALTARGGGSGDIVAKNFPTRTAILASLVTGRAPGRHRIGEPGDLARGAAPDRDRTPVWQYLAQAGQPCVVVGFPLVFPRVRPGNLVVPQERLPRAPLPPGLTARVTGAREIPGELRTLLEESLAGDLGALETARSALAADHRRHLFLHLAGLGRWEAALRGALPEAERAALSAGYYQVLDALVGDLLSRRGGEGAVFLVSEQGNLDGRPSQPRDFPILERYPAFGFLWASGAGIRHGVFPVALQPPDVAATLLYLAGVPLPTTFDGRVAFGLLEENYYFKHPLEFR